MHLISIGVIAATSSLLGFVTTANAAVIQGDTILPERLEERSPVASFSWAGEIETYESVSLPDSRVVSNNDIPLNADFITAIPAPEPPAIVLAGIALGGAICRRSLFPKWQVRTSKAEAL